MDTSNSTPGTAGLSTAAGLGWVDPSTIQFFATRPFWQVLTRHGHLIPGEFPTSQGIDVITRSSSSICQDQRR